MRSLSLCGWAPSGRVAPVDAFRERVLSTPHRPDHAPTHRSLRHVGEFSFGQAPAACFWARASVSPSGGSAFMLRSLGCCVAAACGGRGCGAVKGLWRRPGVRGAFLAVEDSPGAELGAEEGAGGGAEGDLVGVAGSAGAALG